MAGLDALTHAFLQGHPQEAARVLQGAPPEQAAGLLAQVPARIGAGVIAAMLPGLAARLLAEMDDDRVLELLGALDTLSIVGLLRPLPEARRKRLLSGLPTGAALASSMLLGYAEDSLGACCDPDVVALGARLPAAGALDALREGSTSAQQVFVTAAERRLAGWVSLAKLLRAPAGASLESLCEPCPGLLAAHAPLSAGLDHPGWKRASMLPVVEPGQRLVGVLRRETLEQAVARRQSAGRPPAEHLPSLLARGYWDALSAVVEAGSALLPAVRPVAGDADER